MKKNDANLLETKYISRPNFSKRKFFVPVSLPPVIITVTQSTPIHNKNYLGHTFSV